MRIHLYSEGRGLRHGRLDSKVDSPWLVSSNLWDASFPVLAGQRPGKLANLSFTVL